MIENVLINADNPFKLSHKVFQFLVENFLFHDFAVEHFLQVIMIYFSSLHLNHVFSFQGYKFIVGEHFYRTPASFLCTDLKSAKAKLRTVTEAELDSVRRYDDKMIIISSDDDDKIMMTR